jgi:hypothetical protein
MSIALTQIVVFEIVWFVLLVPLFDDVLESELLDPVPILLAVVFVVL